jgi:uncharacterized protein YeaC (DUF1315 family)
MAMVSAMSADTYEKLLDAVGTGRWADGTPLNTQQQEQTMQLVMAYQARVLKSAEPFTIGADGQMVIKSKTEMKAQFSAEQSIARFAHNDL